LKLSPDEEKKFKKFYKNKIGKDLAQEEKLLKKKSKEE